MEYYLLNKPKGLITACKDDNKPTVMELFPFEFAKKLHPIGRLDKDTVGLLLFTDDGLADFALLSPERHVEKEYFFYAIGEIDSEKIKKIENGLMLPNGSMTSKASMTLINCFTVAEIKDYLSDNKRSKYLKNPGGNAFCASLIIHEGKKHEVKLLLHSVGCHIVYLERTRIGEIHLSNDLPRGKYRPLTQKEIEYIETKKLLIVRKK